MDGRRKGSCMSSEINSLIERLTFISNEINVQYDAENIEEMAHHLSIASSLGGTIASAKSNAEYIMLKSMGEALSRLKKGDIKYSPNEIRDKMKADCAYQISIYTMSDTLQKELGNRIDSLRTLISVKKYEMEQSRYQNG